MVRVCFCSVWLGFELGGGGAHQNRGEGPRKPEARRHQDGRHWKRHPPDHSLQKPLWVIALVPCLVGFWFASFCLAATTGNQITREGPRKPETRRHQQGRHWNRHPPHHSSTVVSGDMLGVLGTCSWTRVLAKISSTGDPPCEQRPGHKTCQADQGVWHQTPTSRGTSHVTRLADQGVSDQTPQRASNRSCDLSLTR